MSESGPIGNPPPVATPLSTIPPPCTTVSTRRQTTTYGKLMTGKTKEQLLNHPTVSSSITTTVQAKKHLVEHYLLQAGQDPNYNSLSLALLNLACTAPGTTAVIADAIRFVAILLDTISSSTTPQKTIVPAQPEPTPINLEAQITLLMA